MGAVTKITEAAAECRKCIRFRPLAKFRVIRGRRISECRDCEHVRQRARNKVTPYNTLRAVVRGAKKRGVICTITPSELLVLWATQDGKCALSGVQMTFRQGRMLPTSVSVDRIVARKGYSKGNVRLVCTALNALRGSATDEEAYRLAKAFVQRWEESHGLT